MATKSQSEFEFKDKKCGECAYLTEKAPIKYQDLTEEKAGLCRFYILHNNFALLLKDEKACPEFISNE